MKYLGVLEVKDSRGVAHCEEAVKRHKQRKERNKTRALLCISPETIRLVKVTICNDNFDPAVLSTGMNQ